MSSISWFRMYRRMTSSSRPTVETKYPRAPKVSVGRPTGNAVAERFIATLKIELLWTRDWESIEELRSAVREWLRSYNYERPHQALNDCTPAEKREKNLGCERFAA